MTGPEALAGFLKFAFVLSIYCIPTFIAAGRNHHNIAPIGALNLLLGWTVIGWVAAFIWSLTTVPPAEK